MSEINPFRYAGYIYDEETGLYYLNSRYYDPRLGRFLTKDTIPKINHYVYANNNPVMFVDPSGHIVETIFDSISLTQSTMAFIGDPNLVNAAFLAWDVAATAVPFVTGSYTAKGVKYLDDLVNTRAYASESSKLLAVDFNYFRKFESHFKKHVYEQAEFGAIPKEKYFTKALDLATSKSSNNIIRKMLSSGREAVYNISKNELVIVHNGSEIGTFFKPIRGLNYFKSLK